MLAAYAAVLGGACAVTAREDGEDDVGMLAGVFALMHFAWGAGFLAGCVKWGPPWKGLLHAARLRRPTGSADRR